MKTISELNSKWWYRLIKVIFALTFIFVQIVVGFGIFTEASSAKDFVINCDNGRRLIKNEYEVQTDAQKYHVYRECSEADFQLSELKTTGKVLSEDKRSELDVIVLGMIKGGSSDKTIQAYVDNYKETYGTVFDPTQYGAIPTEKGKSYTFQEVFGNMDTSNGWIKKIDGVSILSNFKTSYAQKYSTPLIALFVLGGFVITSLFFWLIARTFFYVLIGESFLILKKNK